MPLTCPHCHTVLKPYPLMPMFPRDCYWCSTCKHVVILEKEKAA
jgi:prepilin signal peptidase PulO-like enzyme (type II secretory pathway)